MASEIRANKQTNRVGLGTVTYTDTGIIVSGIVTANSFKGDGSSLTGIDATALKDGSGNTKVQASQSGAVHSGVSTFQNIDVDGHTNLDNTSIVGVATLTASSSGTGILRIEGAVQGTKIVLNRSSTSSVAIKYQNNFGSLFAGLGDGFNNDQRFVIGKSGTLSNNPILQASEQYNVIVGTGITLSGTTGNATYSGIVTASSFIGDGSSLSNLPAGAPVGGASTNTVFFENDTAVAVNYQITSGKNAMSAGPIAINAGIAVTVPSGSSWTIV